MPPALSIGFTRSSCANRSANQVSVSGSHAGMTKCCPRFHRCWRLLLMSAGEKTECPFGLPPSACTRLSRPEGDVRSTRYLVGNHGDCFWKQALNFEARTDRWAARSWQEHPCGAALRICGLDRVRSQVVSGGRSGAPGASCGAYHVKATAWLLRALPAGLATFRRAVSFHERPMYS